MIKKRWITSLKTATILVAVLGAGCAPVQPLPHQIPLLTKEGQGEVPVPLKIPINADVFVDPTQYRSSQNIATVSLKGRPIAGVVNHHALAPDLLTRFFRELHAARPDVTRFIMLSPDHFKRGSSPVTVGAFDYTTHGHSIKVDEDAITTLERSGATPASRQMMEGEHGIGALLPFLAREYPGDIQLIPIAIRSDVSRNDIAEFGKALAPFIDDHTFIIVSSDMSHYLTEAEALKNDITTGQWLTSRDLTAMSRATDDYTDNGPAFVALFSLLKTMKLELTFEQIDHSISTRYGGDPKYTTSYITGVWSVR
ncbi:MAG: AmmeMemoRadiSam system protein B [Patescibacteria group bacterium]